MWVVSSVVALAGAVLTAALGGYTGLGWLLVLPLFIGYLAGAIALQMLAAIVLTTPVNLEKPVKKPSGFYTALYNYFIAFFCSSARMKVIVSGREKLEKGKKYLFVYNHRSNFDPMIISKYFRRYKILMISKPQNFKIIVAGRCIHKAGFMPIDRENDREALKTILKAAERLREGYSVGVAPEGTRNKTGIDLLPFRNGCFKITQKAKADVCVLAINGTEKVVKNFPLKRTTVYLDVVSVIPFDETSTTHASKLGERVRAEMLENIEKRNGISLTGGDPR